MAHYALLNENNIVVEVIVGRDEDEVVDGVTDWEQHYGEIRGLGCKRTSYNTRFGEHILGGTPFRKNYAGVGYTYDEQRDAFIAPQPFPSWTLDEDRCEWVAPVPHPERGMYDWDEATQSWVVPQFILDMIGE